MQTPIVLGNEIPENIAPIVNHLQSGGSVFTGTSPCKEGLARILAVCGHLFAPKDGKYCQLDSNPLGWKLSLRDHKHKHVSKRRTVSRRG